MLRPNDDTQHRTNTYYAWGVCGFLLLAIGLIYAQTLGYPLINFDDNVFVFENPHVTPGLTAKGIRWAFTDGPNGEWYPLAPLSHMLDCQLFGLHAWGHHLTNVLFHAAVSIALFLVLWRMTGELWPSAFVATIFAVHPQHVESVAWVAERKDVLSGLFFVLTLGAWLGYVRQGRSLGRYLLVTLLFALGLMSKPMLVTLPALLLLLDFWPLARFGHAADVPNWAHSVERPGALRLVLEKLPLLALAVADGVITLRTHDNRSMPFDWTERIGNAAISYVTYVVQFFYPVDLAVFYPLPLGGPPPWKVAGAIAILAVTSAAAVIWRRRCPYLFVGWFWFLGMLAPLVGVINLGLIAMADRYIYLPGIGLYIALAWGATRLVAGSPEGRWVLGTCAGLAIAVLVACAAWQTSFWHDDVTLWSHTLAVTTDNAKAEIRLADEFVRQGRLADAIPYYHRALAFAPNVNASYDAHLNLGVALLRQDKFDEAMAQFQRALELVPDSYDAHLDLGIALTGQKRFDESIQQLRRAIDIDPLRVSAHGALAYTLRLDGKIDQAIAELERAVRLDPRNIAAQNELGWTLFTQGKSGEAIPHFEAALAVDPNSLWTHVNLAHALAARGRIDEAVAHYRQALQIDPNNTVARQNLDKLLHDNAFLLKP
jgi:tetratricopeptide (TPR) repeat protein